MSFTVHELKKAIRELIENLKRNKPHVCIKKHET